MARERPDGVLILYKETWETRGGKVWLIPHGERHGPRPYQHTVQKAYRTWIKSMIIDMILSDSTELADFVAR